MQAPVDEIGRADPTRLPPSVLNRLLNQVLREHPTAKETDKLRILMSSTTDYWQIVTLA
jgi:hypothetical protein